MKFLKVEWTKKRGTIALLATGLVVTSFILGGYVATGNWNPWGNRHYYQILNANFQECHTIAGVQSCSSSHNVIFDASAKYVEQVVEKGTGGLCTVGATCSFNFIAMTSNAVAPTAGMTSTGATNGACGNAGTQGGTELTTNGYTAAAGAVTDVTGSSPQPSTIVKQFTDTTAATTVAQSCLVNESTIDANRVNLAAQTFTAITLQIGDTITITWTITWTWS
jgi:type IV secretory pathway VirJ component